MLKGLKFAALMTLIALLSGAVPVLIVVAYLTGEFDVVLFVSATLVFDFLLWLAAPIIMDQVLKVFYGMKFLKFSEVKEQYPEIALSIEKICSQNKLKTPKVGFINNDNPTSFVYGSLPSNARFVITKGLFTYLKTEEREAVLAHEMGHLASLDFIIMTMAWVLPMLYYELYAILSVRKRKRLNNAFGGIISLMGLIPYVLYILGIYPISSFSRKREYYADEFSARSTGNPGAMIRAMVRMAYGAVVKRDDMKSDRLIESTRVLGPIDIKASRGVGIMAEFYDNPDILSKVIAFDFVSPWSEILELNASHPLMGKRIEKLNTIACASGKEKVLGMREAINTMTIDKIRLYNNFVAEAVMFSLPFFAVLIGLLFGLYTGGNMKILMVLSGVSFIILALYEFFERSPQRVNIKDLMLNIYVSPLKGKKVIMEGKIIEGASMEGAMNENLIFEDGSGAIRVHYDSIIGTAGNSIFALARIKKLLGQNVFISGWFFRGTDPFILLERIKFPGGSIGSYPRLFLFFGGILLVIIGIL